MAQRNAPLRLRFAEGELTVSAQTQDVGEASESMPVPFAGEPLEIGFNAEFLRDGLESVDGDEVRLKLISPLRPGLIKGEGDDFWYLIMPIRLRGLSVLSSDVSLRDFRSYARLELGARGRASCSSSARTAPARRTCWRRCTSARRASRRARAPTRSSSASATAAARVAVRGARAEGRSRSR